MKANEFPIYDAYKTVLVDSDKCTPCVYIGWHDNG